MRIYQPFRSRIPLLGLSKARRKNKFAVGFEVFFLEVLWKSFFKKWMLVHFIWYGEGTNDSDDEEENFLSLCWMAIFPTHKMIMNKTNIALENGKWMIGIRSFPFGAFGPIFRGELAVSFREGNCHVRPAKWKVPDGMKLYQVCDAPSCSLCCVGGSWYLEPIGMFPYRLHVEICLE